MRKLNKRTLINFVQCRPHRQGGRLFLLLAVFVMLSLALTTFVPDQALLEEGNNYGKATPPAGSFLLVGTQVGGSSE